MHCVEDRDGLVVTLSGPLEAKQTTSRSLLSTKTEWVPKPFKLEASLLQWPADEYSSGMLDVAGAKVASVC